MSRKTSSNPAERARITRDAVVDAAFSLVERTGVDGLSMRALADALGVQAPTIYWHAGGKPELLRLMAARIYGEASQSVPYTDDWRQWLIMLGRAFRASLSKRKDSARICVIAKYSADEAPSQADIITAPLMKAGLDRRSALTHLASVMSFTLGLACYEQSETTHDYFSVMIDFDETFETGLTALVRGFKAGSPSDRDDRSR